MPSEIIETVELPVESEAADKNIDERLRKLGRIHYLTILALEGYDAPNDPETREVAHEIREVYADSVSGRERSADEEDYIRALEAAFYCGRDLFARDDIEDLKDDFSQIDAETLREIRSTLVYVGPHFGVTVDLPPAGTDGEPA